jgi:hypothetical protein
MKEEHKKSEEQKTSANYIINFYVDVQALTNYYSAYLNLMLEIKSKGSKEALEDEDKHKVQNAVTIIRQYATTCFITYKALSEKIKSPKNKKIDDAYKGLKENYIVKLEDVEMFVIELNSVLVSDIMTNILKTSQDIVDSVYKE